MSTRIHVACAADERYAPHCAAMLHSLLRCHPEGVTVHFLHSPTQSAAMLQGLTALVLRGGGAIRLHEIPDHLISGLPAAPRIPRLMWYRIFLPQLLPELDKILYLDADTLVVDRLDELWATPLDGHPVAAVTNFLGPDEQTYVRSLGMNPVNYFNSGVLLMNLAVLRRCDHSAQVHVYGASRRSSLRFPDQDSLNKVLAGRQLRLHPRWNCMNSLFYFPESRKAFGVGEATEAVRKPAILHFEGPGAFKPWHSLNEHPFRYLYQQHLRESGWPAPIRPALQVACAADEHYASYCAAMLHSLLKHNPDAAVSVHYLHPPEFALQLQDDLRKLVSCHGGTIRFHPIEDSRVQGLPDMRGIQRIVWYRIFLADLLPELDRILYLDADTLVVAGLEDLWQTDLKGTPVGAVRNPIDPALHHRMADLRLPDDTAYFNSGVLLMDLRAWRQGDYTERICEIARNSGLRLLWADQDVLNIVFENNYQRLHPRWNCQNTLFLCRDWAEKVFGDQLVAEALSAPAIIHFEGPGAVKPWHYLSSHPYRPQYWAHLRASGLPVPRAEGFTIKSFVRKHTQWIPDPPRSQLYRLLSRATARLS